MHKRLMVQILWAAVLFIFSMQAENMFATPVQKYNEAYDVSLISLFNNLYTILYCCIFVIGLAFPSVNLLNWIKGRINKNDYKEVYNTLKMILNKSCFASFIVTSLILLLNIGLHWDRLFPLIALWIHITFSLPVLIFLVVWLMSWLPRYTSVSFLTHVVCLFLLLSMIVGSMIIPIYMSNIYICSVLLLVGIICCFIRNHIVSLASKEISRIYSMKSV